MPTLTDLAIVLRRWDYSETSQTVRLLTREHGALRGLAKGSKRPRSTFSGGFELLTVGEVVLITKPGRELANVIAWHLVETNRGLRQDLAANRAAIYVADLVHHMVTDADPHPELFDGVRRALAALCEEPPGPVLLAVQWSILNAAGYRPELDHDAETGGPLSEGAPTYAFSPSAGGVVEDTSTPDRWRVRATTIELLRRVAAGEDLSGERSEDAQAGVERANRLLAVYCRAIIGHELPSTAWAFGGAL